MSKSLQLTLLGGCQISRNGTPVTGFISSKAQALLCYLAVTGRVHLRSSLATLLWGDMPDADAKTNLRMVLANLRRLLGPYLVITRQTVAFNQESQYWLDVEAFTQRVATVIGAPLNSLTTEQLAALQEAADLYPGDFLAGFYVRDAPAFEEWASRQRERLLELALETLHTLAVYYAERRAYVASIDYITRLLVLAPWREEAHRQMMLLLARRGQRSAALAQYETCRRVLAEELGVEPMAETTALYQRLRAAETTSPHNLPPHPTPFIGREDELNEITQLLTNPDCRLVTITGPGGIGKTRLALQVARAVVNDFLDGVYFVPLAAINSIDFFILALADTLNFSVSGSPDSKARLFSYLRDREMLLVLDNFEHLVEEAELLAEISRVAPAVKILVTSQERLNLHGEWVFEVPGLSFPAGQAGEAAHKIEAVESYSAVQLFVQSARRVQADFSLSDKELPFIVRVCQLVAGIPLAIELAATWVRVLSCRDIAAEIERDLDFLTTSLRDVPARHRSLRAVFTHSWQLLTTEEQRVFRRLAVFWGGFRREAAETVADASLPTLSALVDKSLLRWHNSDQERLSGRYEMHELIKQYAAEKLLEIHQEEEETLERHCRYYTEFLHQRQPDLVGCRQQETLAEIRIEIKNVRAAWCWVLMQKQVTAIERSLPGLSYFYEMQGWFQEGVDMLNWTRKALAEAQADEDAPQRERVLAQVLAQQGGLLDRLGRYDQAKALLEESLATFDRLGLHREKAFSFHHLGYIAFMRGEYTAAKKHLEEGLAIYREAEDRWGIASSLNVLGDVVIALGAYAEAKQLFQESLTITEALGAREGIGWACHGLGDVHRLLDEHPTAQQYYQRSLTIFEAINAREGIAWSRHSLGDLAIARQAYLEAKQYYEQSLAIFEEIGDRGAAAETLNALGNTACALGAEAYPQARETFHRALRVAMEVQVIPVVLNILVGLATILMKEAELEPDSRVGRERALELLTLALDHPAGDHETKDRATCLIAELAGQLPPAVVEAARIRAKARTLEEVTTETLK